MIPFVPELGPSYTRTMKRILGLTLLGVCGMAHATVYDLKTDWSDASNPNGTWSYREGNNALPHVNSWQSSLGGWSSAQPGWARSENNSDRIPFVFKSNGTETFAHDFIAGDIVMHTWDGANGIGNGQGNIAWTSPITGTVSITGAVWMGRDIGRAVDWSVLKNAVQLTDGHLFSGDSFSRATPYDLLAGSGGAGSLSNISVSTGDVLILKLTTASGSGDFVGMNYTINATAVPEPTALAVLCLGSVGVWMLRRRRL